MRVRKLYVALLALSLALVSSAAMALDMVYITERFFNPQPFGVKLCAQTVPGIPNVPMTFYGESVFGIDPVPANTVANSLGYGCATAFWPVGVYAVQVSAGPLWSPFVAVTVADTQRICCGVAGGGQVGIFHYGPPFNTVRTLQPRFASFGILYDEGCSPGRCPRIPFQLLYFDHDNPLGSISFVAKSFMQVQHSAMNNPGQIVTFVGNGLFQQGAGPEQYVRYYLKIIDGSTDKFCLELRNFAGQVIYRSSAGINWEGTVINGEIIIDCAG